MKSVKHGPAPGRSLLGPLTPAKRAWLATGAVLTSACGGGGGGVWTPTFTAPSGGFQQPSEALADLPVVTITYPKLPGAQNTLLPGNALGMDGYYGSGVNGVRLVPGDIATLTYPDGCTMEVVLDGGPLRAPKTCTREDDEQDDDQDLDQDDDRDSDSRDDSRTRSDQSSNGGGGGGGGGLVQSSLLTTTGTIVGTLVLTKTIIDQVQDDDDTDDTPPVSP